MLGYSGGPDSKALLYSLIESGVKPHLAHVDHGWREESRDEADRLGQEAADLGCPFFSVRLDIPKKEDEARKGRISFFQTLFPRYRALLLAHQADDLAETVLKRVLEGAHLSNLGGMQPVSQQYGMTFWRPFLTLRRSEILSFLDERALTPLIDSSNSDSAYLRSRMRMELFPFLNEKFGKETIPNLTLLSERALELKRYLDGKVEAVPVERGPWGVFVNLNSLERVEQRHLIQKIAREESISLSRDAIETILDWVEEGRENVKIKKIWVDRGRVFFFSLSTNC